ncbi:hypothetical protein GYMLUDRAFT_45079 [Collybiopsis luxurians FD-317 M1]|uniref:Uncharacterized protein n=1 Tax=Collybiopsis luxurians FD-317 M1 TaxID=944289 RepID=A0A0D0BTK8_9AGAR|nr:hypothetical protein GYMLUDRAFT_45079 [Collybiopsis luxurians FD-317 M1]
MDSFTLLAAPPLITSSLSPEVSLPQTSSSCYNQEPQSALPVDSEAGGGDTIAFCVIC